VAAAPLQAKEKWRFGHAPKAVSPPLLRQNAIIRLMAGGVADHASER
jgi:hypothetical protein